MRSRFHRVVTVAAIGLVAAITMFTVTATASARPPSDYRNWAQTPHNSAGVVFHPRGDWFEVWNNKRYEPGDYGVSIAYNYKGIRDRWKSAGEIAPGTRHTYAFNNFREHRHIFFYIVGPDNTESSISEYRTS